MNHWYKYYIRVKWPSKLNQKKEKKRGDLQLTVILALLYALSHWEIAVIIERGHAGCYKKFIIAHFISQANMQGHILNISLTLRNETCHNLC